MKNELKIKVCGMKYPENMRDVAGLDIEIQGYIFYAPSKRDVGHLEEENKKLLFQTNKEKAGVFVNKRNDFIQTIAHKYKLDYIQLHGDESPDECKQLKVTNCKIIKAFRLDETFDFSQLSTYKGIVDFFLFDTKAELIGGTGKKFDWSILDNYKLNIPFFLSGGIGPNDASSIQSIDHKMFHGIDLNSGFEDSPGLKNIEKLRIFISQLK